MKISFVIPAYNAAATVSRCLDSVIAQTDSDWEVVVVDDGSKDSTYEIVKTFVDKDPRIIALTQENQGPGMARNNAMGHASGEYIAFLDADDYIEPDYVTLVKEKILSDDLDVVVLDNYYENSNGKLIRMEVLSQYAGLDKDSLIGVQMTGKMPWGGCRKVVKRELIESNGIEYSHDPVGEEAVFSFRVFYHAKKIGFLGKPVYHYIDYPMSQSKKGEDDPWGGVVKRLQSYLEDNYLISKFRKQLNSFAYTALLVSLYRIANQYDIRKAVELSRESIIRVKETYGYMYDASCIEKRVKLLMPFMQCNFVLPILVLSRLKKKLK